MHPYERWIARRYLANALKSKRRQAERPNEYFHAWTSAHGRSLGVPPLRYKSESGRGDDHDGPAAKLKLKAEWRRWRAAAVASAREPRPPISPLQKRVDWLGEVCELNPSQRFLLGLFARIARVQQVRDLVGAINREDHGSEQFDFAELRPVLDAQVDRRDLSEHGLLTRFGLIEKDDNDNCQISEPRRRHAFEEAARRAANPGIFFSASRLSLRWAGTISPISANCATSPRE